MGERQKLIIMVVDNFFEKLFPAIRSYLLRRTTAQKDNRYYLG